MAYRGAIIGLGWMGMLYDLAQRMGEWHVDDIDRPTPDLDIHRRFPYHERHRPRSSSTRAAIAASTSSRPLVSGSCSGA